MNLVPNRKIALYAPSLRGGGVERNMVNLSRGLVEKGYPVDLVLNWAEGPFLKELDSRVNLVDLASSRTLFSIPQLARYLRKARPAVLLSAMDHANFAAILARNMAATPCRVVVSVHTLWSTGAFTEKWLDRNASLVGRYLYPRTDGIITVSQAVATDLVRAARLDPDSVTAIPNPVVLPDVSEIATSVPDHPFLKEGHGPVVVAVGRLSAEKGFDVLIQAHALLLEQGKKFHLLILGEGRERPSLESLVEELGTGQFVDMPGFVDAPAGYIARATVLVMPSRVEGFGNALVEAMACGVPVVATDHAGGPSEILDGGRYGPLVPQEDPAALAEAVTDCMLDPVPSSILMERAAEFSVDRVVDRYLEVLFQGEALS